LPQFTLDAVDPTVQSTFEPPGMPTDVPMNPVERAIGLDFVPASPGYTRTSTRFMLWNCVSK
jgi:hypothetical protein